MIRFVAAVVDRALAHVPVRIPHWLRLAVQLAAVLAGCFAFVCVLLLILIYGETHWLPDRQMALMATFTAVIFGAVISEFKRWRRHWRFWLALAGLFVVHVIACAMLWSRRVDGRTIHYAMVSLIEIPMLCTVLDAPARSRQGPCERGAGAASWAGRLAPSSLAARPVET